jgi:hypothetical protein
MAETTIYDLPYPTNTDPVDVAGDIQSLAEAIDAVLPTIGLPFHTLEIRNVSGVSIAKGDPVYITGYSTKPTQMALLLSLVFLLILIPLHIQQEMFYM